MLKIINIIKLSSTTFLGVLASGTLLSQSAMAAPVGIDSLDTTRVDATPSTHDFFDGSSCEAKNYGTGTNIRLNGFTVESTVDGTDVSKDYSIHKLVDEARFQRVDNDNVSGERHIYFIEKGSNGSYGSSAIFNMQDAVRNEFINAGTDNVFANDGGTNINNIERIDFLIESGLIVREGYVNDAGFLLLERGGNDSLKIAAIKGIDVNGNPNQFGQLIDIPKSTWGDSNIQLKTKVIQNKPNWSCPKETASVNQNIHGIFVSIASLGIDSGETIYGYALFPGDINSSSDLVGLSDFPLDTDSGHGAGGIDLISSGGLFTPDDATDPVFEPPSAVNDAATTNEDTSVTGNVLTNDTGENPIVTSTGSQTLESGALVTINSDGTFSYDPNGNFESLNDGITDTDTFRYTMRDDSNQSSSAVVTVTITGITDSFAD